MRVSNQNQAFDQMKTGVRELLTLYTQNVAPGARPLMKHNTVATTPPNPFDLTLPGAPFNAMNRYILPCLRVTAVTIKSKATIANTHLTKLENYC